MNPEELKQHLANLKQQLEEAADAKAKSAIEAEMKKIQAQLDSVKDVPELRKELDTTKAKLEATEKEVAEMKAAAVEKDEADKKNQKALDDMQSEMKTLRKFKDKKENQPTLEEALMTSLNEGDNFKNLEMMATNHKDRLKKFSIELKTVGDVSVSGNYTGSRALQVLQPGIIQNPSRKVHIRTLMPGGTVGQGTSYVFMKESGAGEGAPAFTAESTSSSDGLKPQVDFDLAESSVNIETLAAIMPVSRKAMNNIPGFVSFLGTRLPERMLRVEDTQLLNGDGNTPNIKGIMQSGNFTAATTSSSFLGEQLIDGIAQLEDTLDRSATGILLRPVDYYSFFKHKASTSGEYDLPLNFTFVNGVLYISGVPIFASTGMISDQYIIGDWQMGAQLLTQEAMRVEFFEQDSDNVRRNKITVRIEETVAFPIYGSDYFIVGSAGS